MDWLGDDYPFSTTALVGKHAIVCGASKGIGAATAKMLAKAGAKITALVGNKTLSLVYIHTRYTSRVTGAGLVNPDGWARGEREWYGGPAT